MVIIFDDNEHGRELVKKSFRMADVPMITREYKYYNDYEKPLLTILVDPKPTMIKEYIKAKDTVLLIVARKMVPEYEVVRNIIINDDLEIKPNDAIETIKKEYGFTFVQDTVNFITIVDDSTEKDVYFGGHKLKLTKTEFYILRFFAYQRFKTFDIDLTREYLFLEKRLKDTSLEGIFSTINGKCRDAQRERIIINDSVGYRITEVTGVIPWMRR